MGPPSFAVMPRTPVTASGGSSSLVHAKRCAYHCRPMPAGSQPAARSSDRRAATAARISGCCRVRVRLERPGELGRGGDARAALLARRHRHRLEAGRAPARPPADAAAPALVGVRDHRPVGQLQRRVRPRVRGGGRPPCRSTAPAAPRPAGSRRPRRRAPRGAPAPRRTGARTTPRPSAGTASPRRAASPRSPRPPRRGRARRRCSAATGSGSEHRSSASSPSAETATARKRPLPASCSQRTSAIHGRSGPAGAGARARGGSGRSGVMRASRGRSGSAGGVAASGAPLRPARGPAATPARAVRAPAVAAARGRRPRARRSRAGPRAATRRRRRGASCAARRSGAEAGVAARVGTGGGVPSSSG